MQMQHYQYPIATQLCTLLKRLTSTRLMLCNQYENFFVMNKLEFNCLELYYL